MNDLVRVPGDAIAVWGGDAGVSFGVLVGGGVSVAVGVMVGVGVGVGVSEPGTVTVTEAVDVTTLVGPGLNAVQVARSSVV